MASDPGSFVIVGQSGVPAMHAALMPNGRVVFLDEVENYTQLKLPNGEYAYSAEHDPATSKVVPLTYKTNAFCAGGTFVADGRLVSLGGIANLSWLDPTIEDGWRAIRYLTRSSVSADDNGEGWVEPGNQLNAARWYPSAQTMPDGTVFVASGSLNGLNSAVYTNNNPTYEFLNAAGISQGVSISLPLLVKAQPYYMYPFIHLLPDSSLFIFASKSSELFTPTESKPLPDLPGDFRTYPNTGSSVLLPFFSSNNWVPSILICGGGAYQDLSSPTDPSCGRISPLSKNAQWEMDAMPSGHVMVEPVLLPDGTVLWLNGARTGAQGFGLAINPQLEILLYDPSAQLGNRWSRGASSTIPRLYHSVALLLLDGTVMIAGSNPVQMPVLTPDAANPFPTEFRVEIYIPPYLSTPDATARRPTAILMSSTTLTVQSTVTLTFTSPSAAKAMSVVLHTNGFVTHSLHMGARMLVLDMQGFVPGEVQQTVRASLPGSSALVPPGPYVIFVVVDGVPGVGQFVLVG